MCFVIVSRSINFLVSCFLEQDFSLDHSELFVEGHKIRKVGRRTSHTIVSERRSKYFGARRLRWRFGIGTVDYYSMFGE